MRTPALIVVCLGICLFLSGHRAGAQPQSAGWTFRVTPYFVGAAMTGDMAIHGRSAEVDASFSDVLKNLEFGGMLNMVATLGAWSFSADVIYMGLGSATTRPPAEIDLDQWMAEFDAAYQINSWLGALAGVRINALSGDIQFEGEREKQPSGNRYWIDPVVGTMLGSHVGERWTLRGRADIGGFGIGSRLTWQLQALVEYRASGLIQVLGGYRWLYNDYERGSGNDQFRYDMTVSGPVLGISFAF